MNDRPEPCDTLGRQLRRLGIDGDQPDASQWAALLQRVSETYEEHDQDRELLERSLEISSREMRDLYDELQRASEGQLAFERDRLQAVFDAVNMALLVVDQHGVVNAANPEAVRLLGPRANLVGAPLTTLLNMTASRESGRCLLDDDDLAAILHAHRWQAEGIYVRPAGQQPFPGDCVIVPFQGGTATGDAAGAVVVLADNSDREADQAKWTWQATHDPLTGLCNRAAFIDRMQHALNLAERHGSWPSVFLLNLDRFKSVNDQLGERTGDRLLIEAARRIEKTLRTVDTVARLDGGEFVVLCEAMERPDIAVLVAARLLGALEVPFHFDGEVVYVTASIGIALADEKSRTADQIMQNADLAMFRAKELGRNRMETFDDTLRPQTRRRVHMERALREAIDNDEISVVYQPIFDIEYDRVVAFEALARWHHHTLGTVAPDEFIALAEDVGLITAIGERVLDIACRDASSWMAAAGRPIGLHVNVSSRQLTASTFVNFLARVLKHHHLAAETLTLELTESMLLDNPERSEDRFIALREIGVRIAIDDFGTVYSSLAHVRRFPIDVVKLNRQFVAGLIETPQSRDILQAVVELAAGFNYTVIAEGVEQADELDVLRSFGCNSAQGYFLGVPLPPTEALLLAAASTHQALADSDHRDN
jgi:diguanylate cyclase (GGDEF)-like protein